MAIVTKKYVRKPLYVDAIQITMQNIVEVASWCQGEIKNYNDKVLTEEEANNETIERYIAVRVHNPKNVRQTKAFIGDWLLYTTRGYKVYTQKAFNNSFDEVTTPPESDEDPYNSDRYRNDPETEPVKPELYSEHEKTPEQPDSAA